MSSDEDSAFDVEPDDTGAETAAEAEEAPAASASAENQKKRRERARARQAERRKKRRARRERGGPAAKPREYGPFQTRDLRIFEDGEDDPLKDVDKATAYPEWSWDHVRPWVSIRRNDAYDDDQVEALAKQDIVLLEKANGVKTYGSVEKGSLAAAKRIKALNKKVKILFYLNTMVHYGGYDANAEFDKNKKDWALPGRNGEEYFLWRGKFAAYDHTSEGLREWWIGRALDMMSHDLIDGVFMDAIPSAGRANRIRPGHLDAYLVTANTLRSRLPRGKLMIGNALRATPMHDGDGMGGLTHLKYLDGGYLEGWENSLGRMEYTLPLITTAQKQGRMIMLKTVPFGHGENKEFNEIPSLDERYEYLADPKYIDFVLGYFLLTVGPNSYFSYRSWVDANPRKKDVWDNTRFEAVMRKLGEPMGDMVTEGDGQYSREFQYLKLHVDIKEKKGRLTVKGEGGDEL